MEARSDRKVRTLTSDGGGGALVTPSEPTKGDCVKWLLPKSGIWVHFIMEIKRIPNRTKKVYEPSCFIESPILPSSSARMIFARTKSPTLMTSSTFFTKPL